MGLDQGLDRELLARQLWTLGDINRLRLLALLPTSPDCQHRNNVTQLAFELGLSQPTVSNHLARLRTLGLVRCKKMCRDVFYWIDEERAEEVIASLQQALKLNGSVETPRPGAAPEAFVR